MIRRYAVPSLLMIIFCLLPILVEAQPCGAPPCPPPDPGEPVPIPFAWLLLAAGGALGVRTLRKKNDKRN